MWDPTPWVVTDADISPEMARLVAYTASGGAEGIIEPPDLRVRALSTPGNRVRVAPGGALLRNRYSGGGQQTYALRNAVQHESPIITATGSSGGRTDLVVARVLDPNYEGSAPPDPNDFQYARTEIIEGVPSNTRSALDLNLNFPAIALARINIPSSTATITNSMITDLRHVANPRKDRQLIVRPLYRDEEFRLNRLSPNSQQWPNLDLGDLRIPEWAERVRILATWAGVYLDRAGGPSHGRIWVRFGSSEDPEGFDTQHTSWGKDTGENIGDVRETWIGGEDKGIPSRLRGQTKQIRMRGRVNTETTGISRPVLDWLSVVSLDVEFYETAV